MTRDEHLISERGQALILASTLLDDPDRDPDSDIVVLARQLTRAQEEIEELNDKLKHFESYPPMTSDERRKAWLAKFDWWLVQIGGAILALCMGAVALAMSLTIVRHWPC